MATDVTKITIRGVPTDTVRKFRAIAADKTKREKGKRVVPLNEVYVDALNNYVSKELLTDVN